MKMTVCLFHISSVGRRALSWKRPPLYKMTSEEWTTKSIEQMRAVGTYQDAFLPEIHAASLILAARDRAYEEYMKSGGESVVLHISDRGSENYRRNPALDAWMNLDKQALDHWRSLGLTVDSLKRINDSTMQQKKESSLTAALTILADETKGKKVLERNNKIRKRDTKRKKEGVS